MVAGVVGFFVVIRGSAFAAHALPLGAFSGAAAAGLVGASTLLGLVVFSVLGALGISRLGRRGQHDVATALSLVVLLGLGALFLSMTSEYAPEVESLLFGEVLGIASSAVLPVALLGALCVAAVAALYRPLLLTSVAPELAEARGLRIARTELWFLLILATTTAVALPVVGALLVFSLMVGPPAAARSFTDRPPLAMALSVVIALGVVWSSIALSYLTNWPVGFFVGMLGVLAYGTGRLWAWRRRTGRLHRTVRRVTPRSLPQPTGRRATA